MRKTIVSLMLVSLAAGCSYIKRGEDQYRTDTRALLETRNSSLKSCYDAHLAAHPGESGTVAVTFTVGKKSGEVTDIAVDEEASKAPEALKACVTKSLEGLVLKPEDRRNGLATFTWTFKAPAA
jgi:hypothetical protein